MKKNNPKAKKKSAKKSKSAACDSSHLRKSKTDGFLEKFKAGRSGDAMVEYFMNLRVMNPAAKRLTELNEPRREGGFVRLAHAREEFTAPILTKGKSVTPPAPKGKTKPKPKAKARAKRKNFD